VPDRRVRVFAPYAYGAGSSGGSRYDGRFRPFHRRQNQQEDRPADGPQEGCRTLDGGSQKDHAAPDAEKAV